MNFARSAAEHAALPVLLALALAAVMAGSDGGIPATALLGPVLLATTIVVALLERWIPHRADWNRGRGDLLADALYLPTTALVVGVMRPAVTVVGVGLGAAVSRSLAIGLWPASWPLPGQLALAWVVVELFAYWPHRWLHQVPLLWRLHATHHSPERLYWLNATRAHPLEHVFRSCFGLLPLAVAGAGEELLALRGVTDAVVGLFQHANVRMRLGPLNYVFSAAPVHRWHHSRRREEADHNYGDTFIFWDLVFGTYYRPRGREVESLGILGLGAFPKGYLAQIASPLRWRAIEAASAAASDRAPPPPETTVQRTRSGSSEA